MTQHCESTSPSQWVSLHAAVLPPTGRVLDVACGSGRHCRFFVEKGYQVVGVDRVDTGIDLEPSKFTMVVGDLEEPDSGVLSSLGQFSCIVVTNYLHRPLFPVLVRALLPGGVLLYETFADGNAEFGRPSNPNFLLRKDELLDMAANHGLTVLAYDHGKLEHPKPAVVQRIVAQKPSDAVS